MVGLHAGEGSMNKAERAALAHELDKLVGGANPDGAPPQVDQKASDGGDEQPRSLRRPSRDKIKAIAKRLARQMPPLAGDT